jgi:fatty-acyl-CoA synthase
VIGVPGERYGEELMAWVVMRSEATLTDEDVREFGRGKIAHLKIPRYVKFVDAFPMTVIAKMQKFKMRETAIEELGLREAAATATA